MILKLMPIFASAVLLCSCSTNLTYSNTTDAAFLDPGYLCNSSEQVSTITNGKEYTLVNIINATVTEASDCEAKDFQNKVTERHIIVTEANQTWSYRSLLAFSPQNGSFKFLPNWIDMKQNKGHLEQQQLISSIETLPYSFDQISAMKSLDTLFWLKTRENTSTKIKSQMHNYQNGFRYLEESQAGVQIIQCSQNGLQWYDC